MWRTLANIAALIIDTISVLARLRVLALVDIGTISARLIQCEALIANATEHAVNILAFSKNTEIAEHLALVDIYWKF